MRLFHTVAALMVAIPGVVPAMAQSQVKLTVDATMDLYRAGGYNDGSDGIAPAVFSFTAGAGQTITFPNVSGAWTCENGIPEYGGDGTTSGFCSGSEARGSTRAVLFPVIT